MAGLRTPDHVFNFNNNDKKEFDIFTLLLDDNIKINGNDVYFIPVENFLVDEFFGESQTKVLSDALLIKLWVNPAESDLGQNVFNSKYGLFSDSTCIFYGSSSYFKGLEIYPKIGDLIYWKSSMRLFTIENTDYASPNASHLVKQRDLTYVLHCKLFINNNNTIMEQPFSDKLPEIEDFLSGINNEYLTVNNDMINNECEKLTILPTDCPLDVRSQSNTLSR